MWPNRYMIIHNKIHMLINKFVIFFHKIIRYICVHLPNDSKA